MNRLQRYLLLAFTVLLVTGCATSKKQVLSSGSQVEVRSYQTRTYDTADKTRVLRAVMSTLQDLNFVIDKADEVVGIVSATKLDGYILSMSVSVRSNGEQMTVRANAQYNLKAVEQPGPYQDFFTALDKGLFLDDNLLVDSVSASAAKPAAAADPGRTEVATGAEGAFAYYGEAEAEIVSASYDKNMWARALVLADGDENLRKARYIELRAEQLYLENTVTAPLPATPGRHEPDVAEPGVARPAAYRIEGTYISEITSDSPWLFRKASSRRLAITFEQNGNSITGYNRSKNLKISGTLKDDSIEFFLWPSDLTTYEVTGTWKINGDGGSLEGKWHYPNGSGKWNLTRVY